MPTKGKLPTAREMEGQVLAALQELEGDAYFSIIDHQIKENLEPLVYVSQFRKETRDFYETSFSSKCARARRSLRKQGLLIRGIQKGHWRLNLNQQQTPSKVRRAGTSRVENFAAEAMEKLKNGGFSDEAVNVIRELWLEFRMASPEARPSFIHNKEVEAKAISFIRQREKGWHNANEGNPGFNHPARWK